MPFLTPFHLLSQKRFKCLNFASYLLCFQFSLSFHNHPSTFSLHLIYSFFLFVFIFVVLIHCLMRVWLTSSSFFLNKSSFILIRDCHIIYQLNKRLGLKLTIHYYLLLYIKNKRTCPVKKVLGVNQTHLIIPTFYSLHFQTISILIPRFYFYRFQSLS